jgi:hypothetical protein
MHGSTGGGWHGATYATGQSSTLPLAAAQREPAVGRETWLVTTGQRLEHIAHSQLVAREQPNGLKTRDAADFDPGGDFT